MDPLELLFKNEILNREEVANAAPYLNFANVQNPLTELANAVPDVAAQVLAQRRQKAEDAREALGLDVKSAGELAGAPTAAAAVPVDKTAPLSPPTQSLNDSAMKPSGSADIIAPPPNALSSLGLPVPAPKAAPAAPTAPQVPPVAPVAAPAEAKPAAPSNPLEALIGKATAGPSVYPNTPMERARELAVNDPDFRAAIQGLGPADKQHAITLLAQTIAQQRGGLDAAAAQRAQEELKLREGLLTTTSEAAKNLGEATKSRAEAENQITEAAGKATKIQNDKVESTIQPLNLSDPANLAKETARVQAANPDVPKDIVSGIVAQRALAVNEMLAKDKVERDAKRAEIAKAYQEVRASEAGITGNVPGAVGPDGKPVSTEAKRHNIEEEEAKKLEAGNPPQIREQKANLATAKAALTDAIDKLSQYRVGPTGSLDRIVNGVATHIGKDDPELSSIVSAAERAEAIAYPAMGIQARELAKFPDIAGNPTRENFATTIKRLQDVMSNVDSKTNALGGALPGTGAPTSEDILKAGGL